MADYRALEALELHAGMIRAYGDYGRGKPSDVVPGYPRPVAAVNAEMLATAQTVYVDPGIAEGLFDALPTLPTTIPLHHTDLPFPDGWAWFGGYGWSMGESLTGQEHVSLSGLAWNVIRKAHPNLHGGPGDIILTPLVRYDDDRLPVVNQRYFWKPGIDIDDEWGVFSDERHTAKNEKGEDCILVHAPGLHSEAEMIEQIEAYALAKRAGLNPPEPSFVEVVKIPKPHFEAHFYTTQCMVRALAYSLWHFMNQKLDVRERQYPDRSFRRRFEGFVEWKEPPAIEVVKLRVRRSPTNKGEKIEGRTIEVRHVVRGHWRGYWVGPRHEAWVEGKATNEKGYQHTLKWLDAFIRGPDDMPLKNPKKLFSVVR